MLRIYLETNIWNAICDQEADARALLTSLSSKNAALVISPHTVYELARTFTGKRSTRNTKGKELFSCVKAFLDLDILCSKELMELLHEEVLGFRHGKTDINPFLHGRDRATVAQEVDKLANGIVEQRVKEFIAKRTEHAKRTRAGQIDHLASREGTKKRLQQVPEYQLAQWLMSATTTPSGGEILCSHLERIFGPGPTTDYALALLRSPIGRAARALVRADLYYNWRCANRSSNPSDLMDDILHVLQGVYCDVYATAEKNQSAYTSFLLDSRTRLAIYDRRAPIDVWFVGLC